MSLPPHALDALLHLLHEATGMEFPDARRRVAESRIEERMAALGIAEWSEYRRALTVHRREMKELIELVAVNETFFFRHPQQFDALRRGILPAIMETRRSTLRPIRIWSAACATGCEPYSLAIACLEAADWIPGLNFEIIATDIDSDAIEEAGRAEYGERAVRTEMPSALLDRYFRQTDEGVWKPSDEVRRHVSFSRLNLASEVFPAECDVVFCRNVLYYFSDSTKGVIVRRLWRSLPPGRFLVLSPTESLTGFESFFTPSARGEHYFESWTTDTRNPDPGIPPARAERRRPFPSGEIHGQPDGLVLSGVVGRKEEFEPFRNHVAIELGRISSPNITIDCRRLGWISNAGLHELRILLDAVRKRSGATLASALFSQERHLEWFRRAGFGGLVRRLELISAEAQGVEPRTPVRALSLAGPSVPAVMPVSAQAARATTLDTVSSGTPSAETILRAPAAFMPQISPKPRPRTTDRTVVLPEISDRSQLPAIRAGILRALESAAPNTEVVIDMKKCRFADDTVLLAICRAVQSHPSKQRFVIRDASLPCRRALQNLLGAESAGVEWRSADSAREGAAS
jgi:chemotaxis protein methyltransferase CheR